MDKDRCMTHVWVTIARLSYSSTAELQQTCQEGPLYNYVDVNEYVKEGTAWALTDTIALIRPVTRGGSDEPPFSRNPPKITNPPPTSIFPTVYLTLYYK